MEVWTENFDICIIKLSIYKNVWNTYLTAYMHGRVLLSLISVTLRENKNTSLLARFLEIVFFSCTCIYTKLAFCSDKSGITHDIVIKC